MSKHRRPTVGQIMAALGYLGEGMHRDPRVGRFLGRQTRPPYPRLRSLLGKKLRRHERRAAARFLRQRAEAAKAPPGLGAPKRIRDRKPWKRRRRP